MDAPDARLSDLTLSVLLDRLGAKTPTPGGGAVAASVAALSAGLARMVVSYSVGSKKLAEHRVELESSGESLDRASALALRLADEDAEAYAALNDAMKLKGDERDRAMPGAVAGAIAPPTAVSALSIDLLRLYERLAPITNRHLRSDLAIAAVLADAGVRSAAWNIEINLAMLDDESERERIGASVKTTLEESRDRAARVEAACR